MESCSLHLGVVGPPNTLKSGHLLVHPGLTMRRHHAPSVTNSSSLDWVSREIAINLDLNHKSVPDIWTAPPNCAFNPREAATKEWQAASTRAAVVSASHTFTSGSLCRTCNISVGHFFSHLCSSPFKHHTLVTCPSEPGVLVPLTTPEQCVRLYRWACL